jgi:hypothetical protein
MIGDWVAASLTGWTSGQTAVNVLLCNKGRLTTLVFLPGIYIFSLLFCSLYFMLVYSVQQINTEKRELIGLQAC